MGDRRHDLMRLHALLVRRADQARAQAERALAAARAETERLRDARRTDAGGYAAAPFAGIVAAARHRAWAEAKLAEARETETVLAAEAATRARDAGRLSARDEVLAKLTAPPRHGPKVDETAPAAARPLPSGREARPGVRGPGGRCR